jgi:hypothetical protein
MNARAMMGGLVGALLPGVAWAHGGHPDGGVLHAMWHALPWLLLAAAAGLLAAWARRVRDRS